MIYRNCVLLGALACLIAACGAEAPAWSRHPLPPGAWVLLAGSDSTRVSLDTAAIAPAPGGEYRVRLLYQFAQPVGGAGGGRGPGFRVLVSEEVTECEHAIARVFAAEVYDTAGARLARVTRQPAGGPPSMVGGAGAPLCRLLARRARDRDRAG